MPTNMSTALYYPFLTVDEGWLKLSLLYWERMRRIVPKNAEGIVAKTLDTAGVRAIVDAELLVSTPADRYLKAAETRFRTLASPMLSDPHHQVHKDAELLFGLKHPGDVLTWVRDEKLPAPLKETLYSLKLAKKKGKWVLVPDQIAGLYMVGLAAEMADSMNTPLVTDSKEFGPGGEYMLFGAAPKIEADPTRTSLLARIGIEFPSAKSVASLSTKKLLKFRENRADERKRFREVVEGISTHASTITDPHALEDYFADKHNEIKEAMKDHRDVLDEIKVATTKSAFAITVPVTLTPTALAGIGLVNPQSAFAIATAGVAVNIIGWWADHRSRMRKAKENAWHYALSVRKKLTRAGDKVTRPSSYSGSGSSSGGGGGGGSWGGRVMARRGRMRWRMMARKSMRGRMR